MDKVAMFVYAVPEHHPCVVLKESAGHRCGVIRVGVPNWRILRGLFFEPGEPLIVHEVTVSIMQRCGIGLAGITMSLDEASGDVRCVLEFTFGSARWQQPVVAFDAFGFSIAARTPIMMTEREVAELNAEAPSLEALGVELPQGAAQSMADLAKELPHLPDDKLGKA